MSTHENDQSPEHHQPPTRDSVLELEASSRECPHPSDRSRFLASPRDIICGKGFHIVNHHGNLNLHIIVNSYREAYLSSSRAQKASIIKLILGEIKSKGVRFIRKAWDGNGAEEWEEVDEATAHKKVGHALRLRTENETNRESASATAARKLCSQGDSNICALNKLRPTPKTLPTLLPPASIPSVTKRVSPRHRPTVLANPTDIICGRGLHISTHRGNFNLHLVANIHREEYLESLRSQKPKIIKRIIDQIKSSGARFIRRVSDEKSAERWEEVDDSTAYKKVSHALRLRTKNASNRENDTTAAADKFRQGDSNTDDSLNQLRTRCTKPPATRVPSASNRASAYQTFHRQGDFNAFALNQPSTTLSVVSLPSVANCEAAHHRRELLAVLRESDRPAAPSARAESAILNATERNDPRTGASVGALLGAARQPLSQPTGNYILQQQYSLVIGAMMQQLGQYRPC